MNISNETGDLILKILGGIVAFFSLRWLIRIFAGTDGRLDKEELKKLTAYILFIWAFVYVVLKEGSRPPSTDHVFSEIWLFFIISALLTVLSLERIFDSFSKFIELVVKLRTKVPYETKDTSHPTHPTGGTGAGVHAGPQAGQKLQEGD